MTFGRWPRRVAGVVALAIGLVAAALGPGWAAGEKPASPLVLAAVSLRGALDPIAAQWHKRSGVAVTIAYGGSPALARQLERGLAASLFFPADTEWMDYAAQRGLVRADTRRAVAGNTLVLIAPATSTAALTLARGTDLAAALGGGRLAVAQPDTVPAGRAAKAALQSLQLWGGVRERLAPTDDVRAALALVARGEAPLGIVYSSDAKAEPRVRVVAAVPSASHPPIVYSAAVTAKAPAAAEAQAFLDFLVSDAAVAIFSVHGFTRPPPASQK